jgi:hypothetical protein
MSFAVFPRTTAFEESADGDLSLLLTTAFGAAVEVEIF